MATNSALSLQSITPSINPGKDDKKDPASPLTEPKGDNVHQNEEQLPKEDQKPADDETEKMPSQGDDNMNSEIAPSNDDEKLIPNEQESPVTKKNPIDVAGNDVDEEKLKPSSENTANDNNVENVSKPAQEEIENSLSPVDYQDDHSASTSDIEDEDAIHNTLIKSPSKMSFHEGITIEWNNIVVKARAPRPNPIRRLISRNANKTETKTVLHGISGVAEPGNLIAVMGASGAGKTTMLNVLARRNYKSLMIQGQVTVNGRSIGKKITKISAYFQQSDLFMGCLTVKEHLLFQALLRMKREVPYEDRVNRVDEVITQFGLSKCADTVIGIPGTQRGISGGERRRLMFASELIIDAKLLFADEPTSGLDSYMAANVISALQQLVRQGKTVLCTIHQPSSEVYNMFDQVLLMAEGRIAYMGKREEALTFFKQSGYECPVEYNPADYFISLLAINPNDEESSRKRVQAITEAYNTRDIDATDENDDSNAIEWSLTEEAPSKYRATWLEQMYAVLWRSFIILLRNPLLTKVRIGQAIFNSVLAGLIYLQIKYNQDAVQNVGGGLFFVLANASFGNIFSVLRTFTEEVPVFIREHRSRMYRTDVYFLCKNVVELPNALISSILAATITYWMFGLNPHWTNFLVYLAIITLVSNVAISYGYMISCISKNLVVASAISSLFLMPMMLFGGFFVKNGTEKPYFIWLRYLSWFSYSFEALNINQWESFGNLTCNPEIAICLKNGREVLKFYNYDAANIYFDIGMLIMFLFVWRIIAFIALYYRTRLSRES